MKRFLFLALAACGSPSAVVEVPPQELPPPPPQQQQQVVVVAQAPMNAGEHWFGRYTCAQGETDLDLEIDAVSGDVIDATFVFSHGPSNAEGSYKLRGRVSPDGHLRLVPGPWIQRPPNYVSVGMSGQLQGNTYSGRIDNASCGEFVVRRR